MDKTIIAFKERAGCHGGGKGILIGYDHSFTLATNFNGVICYKANEQYKNAQCYTMNERQISMMIREDSANTIAATDFKGVQIVCYEQNKMSESMGSAEQETIPD